MAGPHVVECPGCHQRTLDVAQAEDRDIRYCQGCGFEDVVMLARRRAVAHPVLSVRDRSAKPRDEGRRLRR